MNLIKTWSTLHELSKLNLRDPLHPSCRLPSRRHHISISHLDSTSWSRLH